MAGESPGTPRPHLCKQAVCFQWVRPMEIRVKSSFSTAYLQSPHSKGLTGVSGVWPGNFLSTRPYRFICEHEKDGLRRLTDFLSRYFNCSKPDPFSPPAFWKFYLDESVGVRGELRVGGGLTG